MKRWTAVLLVSLLAMSVFAGPALANQPTEFTVGFTLFDEPDPCHPGETHDVTFTFHVQEMANHNTLVWVVDSEAESTAGYVGNGTETQVVNKKWLIDHFNWQIVNPETGDRFKVHGQIKVDLATGDTVQDVFRMTCMGPTS